MNMSITVPQLFYDLIARVLPEFLFITLLRLQLSGTGIEIGQLTPGGNQNFIASLGSGIALLLFYYFTGIILRAFIFFSKATPTRKKYEEEKKSAT